MKCYAIGRSTTVMKQERLSFFSYEKNPLGDKDITYALQIEQIIVFKELEDALRYAKEKSKIDDVNGLDYFHKVPLVIEIAIDNKEDLQSISLEIIPEDLKKRTTFNAYIMSKNHIQRVYACHYLTGSHQEEKTHSIQASQDFSVEIIDEKHHKKQANCLIL